MKYPIGVQSFETLRKEGFVYIDKTDLVYKLTNEFKYVFLGRPRRFGKSLLMSTIQAYFEGNQELFHGLAIEKLETEWLKYPVIHLDFNAGNYSSANGLINNINDQLYDYEAIYGRNPNSDEPQHRLRWIIKQASLQAGRNVVVLIDEYDKPVLHAIGNEALDEAMRDILKPFFGVLKSEGRYIRFVMLTGVSKFGKLSVFSDLNNIKDISLREDYATICGLTEEEMRNTFAQQIEKFADLEKVSSKRMLEILRKKYDGYRFSSREVHVYNPYSLLNSFSDMKLTDYWFETGTPTFLVKLLRDSDYDISRLNEVLFHENYLYQVDNVTAIPLLYQTGYLTIKDYDSDSHMCTLGYPNEEVEAAFMSFLLPYYSSGLRGNSESEVYNLTKEIKSGNIENFMIRLKSIFYSIPYSQDNSAKVQEDQFRNITYLTFKLLGFSVQAECHMSRGRADAVIQTRDCIYVFEFKVDSTPAEAMAQIINKGYAEPYRVDTRRLVLIGANFSTSERSLTGWEIKSAK